jgi:hypothetical protein
LELSRQIVAPVISLSSHSTPTDLRPNAANTGLKEKTQEQTKVGVGDVWKMMTVPEEGAERLAEIFREIFALSETKRTNHSKSATVDDSIKLSDAQGESEISESWVPKEKQTSDQHSAAEDQKPLR